MSIRVGTQLKLSEPTPGLSSDTAYYLFANSSESGMTTLSWFAKGKNEWAAHLTQIPRQEFEGWLLSGRLRPSDDQPSMPPWNAPYQGMDLDGMERYRPKVKRTLREYAERRFEAISSLLEPDVERRIMKSEVPEKSIRQHITAQQADRENGKPTTKQNTARLLLWYCTYRMFGFCLEALVPGFSGIGKWDRSTRDPASPRLGRPKKNPQERVGHSAITLKPMILASYIKRAGVKKCMSVIYRCALREDFGCRIEDLANGQRRVYHPEGKSFPSYQQYRYHVIKEYGLETVQRSRLGDAEYRSRLAVQKGSFSEEAANFCERAEEDCYHVKERPRQLLSEEPGPPLVVAKIVCTTTGHHIGVGFSYGTENAEAYRLAKFCAAVRKSLMGRLFGLPITDDEWLGAGLPARTIVDRGPGASDRAYGGPGSSPAIREMAPSWSGQSKATVEASHPRAVKVSGEPIHHCSDLNVFQLARRELLRTVCVNQSADASKRLTPDMIRAGVAANPAAIARYLISRGRNDEIAISEERAIREYLNAVEFTLKEDGLWLGCLKFRNTEQGNALLGSVAADQCAVVKGFVYPLSLMLAWIEIKGRLYEVQPVLRIRDDEEQIQITLDDLARLEEMLRKLRADQRENALAQLMKAEERLLEATGVDWHAGSTVRGSAPGVSHSKEWVPTVGKVA